MNKDTYKPISCSFYDRIEAAIVRRTKVELKFKAQNEEVVLEKTLITDTIIRDKAEFIKLEDGREIRMDQILSLDGAELFSDNSCRIS